MTYFAYLSQFSTFAGNIQELWQTGRLFTSTSTVTGATITSALSLQYIQCFPKKKSGLVTARSEISGFLRINRTATTKSQSRKVCSLQQKEREDKTLKETLQKKSKAGLGTFPNPALPYLTVHLEFIPQSYSDTIERVVPQPFLIG